METTKISYYNLKFFVGVFVPCHIPDDWAYRAQKEEKEKERDLGKVLLTSLRVFTHLWPILMHEIWSPPPPPPPPPILKNILAMDRENKDLLI